MVPWGRRLWWLRAGVLVGTLGGALALAGCRAGDPARARFAAGDRYFQAGEYEDAVQEYRAGLDLQPREAAGWNRLGMACRLQFNTSRRSEWKDQELEAFHQAIAVDSTYWPAYVNLGATLYYLGQKETAAPYLRRALLLHPEDPARGSLETLLADTTLAPKG